jgi:ketosteroid isomerase-like protein
MYLVSKLHLTVVAIVLIVGVAWSQSSNRSTRARDTAHTEEFATGLQRVRDTWVREFNAGHADKVAALYAQEAVLMRRNGSVHSRDSIQAELQRSITSEARNYSVQSLHSESTGDIGYDTGIYNEDFPHHGAEGNYLIVLKRMDGIWQIVAHAAVPNPRLR